MFGRDPGHCNALTGSAASVRLPHRRPNNLLLRLWRAQCSHSTASRCHLHKTSSFARGWGHIQTKTPPGSNRRSVLYKPTASKAGEHAAQTPLEGLMQWLVANGVRGFGQEDSKAAIYETDQEERGVLAVQDVAEDEVLFNVPLRLALTDANSNAAGYSEAQGHTWLSKLASQILDRRRDPDSAWQPYVQALPHAAAPQPFLPSSEAVQGCGIPLGQLSPSLIPRLRTVEDLLPGLTEHMSRCSPQEVQWAVQVPTCLCTHVRSLMLTHQLAASVKQHAGAEHALRLVQLVQSRACGTTDAQGQAVRMLVPLVDMLNHQGDESELLPSQPVAVRENTRWDIVQTHGQWEMQVTATRSLVAGEEVSLSYEERENEYFLVQYGFVPMSNVHDAVQLFSSAAAAQAWCRQYQAGAGTSSSQELRSSTQPSGLPLHLQHQVPILQVHTRARMDPDLVAVLNGGTPPASTNHSAADHAVELNQQGRQLALARCWELLHTGVSPLLRDLGMLAADQGGDDAEAEVWVRLLQHYRQVVTAAGGPAQSQGLAAPADQQAPGNPLKQGQLTSLARLVLRFVALKKMVLWDAVTELLPSA